MSAIAARVSTGGMSVAKAILLGGLVAGTLDALDGIAAYGFNGFTPIQVLQYIASGVMGKSAFAGGLGSAAAGALFHYSIALVAAAIYVLASRRIPVLQSRPIPMGLLYGVAVYAFMAYVILPLSAVTPSPFSLPMFLNWVIEHALFVGLPIALYARKAAAPQWE